MNAYRITYTIGEETEWTQIIERNEAAARKAFKGSHKTGIITEIELAEENVPATKQQERDALATIRKIVEELGPQSYIATAFDGCFQDAEDNIENDFGCSMKQKLESAEFAEDQLREKLAAANARLEELGRLVDSLKDERRTLEAKLAGQSLPDWFRSDIHAFITKESAAARHNMEIAADHMAALADTPQDIAFGNAVGTYRESRERRDRCERMLACLKEMQSQDQ